VLIGFDVDVVVVTSFVDFHSFVRFTRFARSNASIAGHEAGTLFWHVCFGTYLCVCVCVCV